MQATAICTWNVNSLRSRLDHVLAFLGDAEPDVLCLQELKADTDKLPTEPFTSRGYHIEAACQKTYNGVALISPYPIEGVVRGFTAVPPDPQARVIAGTVNGIRVVNVYVPNGSEVGSDKYAYKLEWMTWLEKELKTTADPGQPLVLVGDFNVAMDDRDVYNPKSWEGRVLCSVPEREGVKKWLDWGLVDCFRKHHDGAGLYSWWDYRAGAFGADRGLRIDHVWATESLAARCQSCEVDKAPRALEKPSDHAPVTAVFAP